MNSLRTPKKRTCDESQVLFLVEAAGIEPASRDISMTASTCVANCLFLVLPSVYWQDSRADQLGAFFSSLRA